MRGRYCQYQGLIVSYLLRDVETKSLVNKLDCSKLIPCSESLVTINIDDQFSPGKCQVSSLSVVENLVYIGTCWGCLVVAESASLRPVTVFRPYSAEIPSLTSFRPIQGTQCLVSLGRGYRNLIKRSVTTTSFERAQAKPQLFVKT